MGRILSVQVGSTWALHPGIHYPNFKSLISRLAATAAAKIHYVSRLLSQYPNFSNPNIPFSVANIQYPNFNVSISPVFRQYPIFIQFLGCRALINILCCVKLHNSFYQHQKLAITCTQLLSLPGPIMCLRDCKNLLYCWGLIQRTPHKWKLYHTICVYFVKWWYICAIMLGTSFDRHFPLFWLFLTVH